MMNILSVQLLLGILMLVVQIGEKTTSLNSTGQEIYSLTSSPGYTQTLANPPMLRIPQYPIYVLYL